MLEMLICGAIGGFVGTVGAKGAGNLVGWLKDRLIEKLSQ